MPALRVRDLTPADLDTFAACVVRYYEDDPGALPMDFARARAQAAAVLGTGKARLLLLEEGLGHAILVPYWSNEYGGDIVWLDELSIDRSCRGRGWGRAFLAWLEADCRARGITRIELEVHDGNEAAARLYTRAGFVAEARGLYGRRVAGPEDPGDRSDRA